MNISKVLISKHICVQRLIVLVLYMATFCTAFKQPVINFPRYRNLKIKEEEKKM